MTSKPTASFTPKQQVALVRLLNGLIDQAGARVIVEPNAAKTGFWFGGGNAIQDDGGVIWLSGRYRNFGDSRTGLAAGERGLEIAIFRSDDHGQSFQKVRSWSKADLSQYGDRVVSFEGTSLHRLHDGSWELFISSEKDVSYPEPLENMQKTGTGVWSIDVITGPSPDALDGSTLKPVLVNRDVAPYLHVKDPVVYDAADGSTHLIFCSHPFSWSSSNTGLAVRPVGAEDFHVQAWEIISRGATWDVAATRITSRIKIPTIGLFADAPATTVFFYDGAECLRSHEENLQAVSRPRGYSCEEIGGALVGIEDEYDSLERLSLLFPLFVSPYGTGSSRYVEVLQMDDGWLAMWEQGQSNGSQPLVANFLPMSEIESILKEE